MSTTDAIKILNDAAFQLNDTGFVHWTSAELLSYLNAGQVEIATLVPNANATVSVVQLVSGAKQSAPADSIRIIEFIRNMGVNGSTPGNAIREVERKDMDAYVPGWSSVTADAAVVHVMYDAEDDNQTFYVYPPQPAVSPGQIELIYAKIPAAIANSNAGTKITLDDYYANALLDYVLYRAFGKDSEYGNQAARSQNHYQAFANAIGAKFGADNAASNDKNDGSGQK
jgi:hypothetical protein